MVALTTFSNPAPAAFSTAARFSITRSVCARMSPGTSACVPGSRGIWPLVKMRSPATTACEYGPMALGAFSVEIAWFAMATSPSRSAGRRDCQGGTRTSRTSPRPCSAPCRRRIRSCGQRPPPGHSRRRCGCRARSPRPRARAPSIFAYPLHRVHARDVADGAQHVVELLHVRDLYLEGADCALLARARVGLHDVDAHVGEGLGEPRQKSLAVVALDPQVDRALELAVHVPGDVHAPLGIGLHRLLAAAHVHGDAAAAGDEADDGIARHRRAALAVADQHVVEPADAHAAGGAPALRDPAAQLWEPIAALAVAVDRFHRLLLRQPLRRI